ncbi:MAG: hypothetical protein KAT71_06845 [Gammaproteobacteria bacterium]|nr:hypothetical protein [Gammaproteobacteria bacterium]
MSLSAFEDGSGLSAVWFNHWVVGLTGTLVIVTAAALVTLLAHRLEIVEDASRMWIVGYILFVIMMVFVFLGFLNNFWR